MIKSYRKIYIAFIHIQVDLHAFDFNYKVKSSFNHVLNI